MCLECWQVLSQTKAKEHRIRFPSHCDRLLTNKYFTSERKFVAIALALRKVRIEEGEEVFENPYHNQRSFKSEKSEKVDKNGKNSKN